MISEDWRKRPCFIKKSSFWRRGAFPKGDERVLGREIGSHHTRQPSYRISRGNESVRIHSPPSAEEKRFHFSPRIASKSRVLSAATDYIACTTSVSRNLPPLALNSANWTTGRFGTYLPTRRTAQLFNCCAGNFVRINYAWVTIPCRNSCDECGCSQFVSSRWLFPLFVCLILELLQ